MKPGHIWLFGAVAVTALALGGIVHGLTEDASTQASGKPANERALTDRLGRRVVEYRWPLGTPDRIVRLRIPVDYVWFRGAGLRAALGPNYPDPNVVGPFMTAITLQMLLPDLEPRTPETEAIFQTRPSPRKMNVLINTNAYASLPNKDPTIIDTLFKLQAQMLESNAKREFRMSFDGKPDLWGLKHLGAIGDFEKFLEGGGPQDIYFPDKEEKDMMLICASSELKEENEDPRWKFHLFCEHYFYSGVLGANVKLFYSRSYAPGWRDLQDRLENLFASFEIIK